jgi:hypothetical protein
MSSSNAPESEPVEAGLPTAEIIPFPSRPRPAEPRPEDRLSRALASLNAALAEQRVAVAAWREALGELKETTAGLGESLQRYRTNLGSLSGSVSELQLKAQSLEQWADSVAPGVT